MLINLLALSVPLGFSFWKKVRYYVRFPSILATFFTVGTAFLIWDIHATQNGDWGFSETYLMGISLFGLPLEEILFFLFIPYSSLFIYENLLCFFKDKRIPVPKVLNILVLFVCLLGAFLFRDQSYTRTVLLAFGLFFLTTSIFDHDMLESRLFWAFMIITYFPFFIVNYFLTAPPIVWYNSEAIWGIRITAIPLEDFIYSFTMLSFYTLVYRSFRRRSQAGPALEI